MMRWADKLLLRLRSLLRRERIDHELDDELRFHLEQQIEENLAAGMSPEDARYAARRTIGGLAQIKEQCRDTRRVNWLVDLGKDVRYALRILRKSPGFTACVRVIPSASRRSRCFCLASVSWPAISRRGELRGSTRLWLSGTSDALGG